MRLVILGAGAIDLGRYPDGTGELADAIAGEVVAGFLSIVRPNIMKWKRGKLLGRLHGVATPINEALQAITAEAARARAAPGALPLAELVARVVATPHG
jgi:hypothetical protein